MVGLVGVVAVDLYYFLYFASNSSCDGLDVPTVTKTCTIVIGVDKMSVVSKCDSVHHILLVFNRTCNNYGLTRFLYKI